MAHNRVWQFCGAGEVAMVWLSWTFVSVPSVVSAHNDDELPRAVIPRSGSSPVVDGKLLEYDRAFCTPVEYFHPDWKNRAAQFFYLWDDEAFYVGVRTLDQRPFAPEDPFWVGDAVEWYFDTRAAPAAGRLSWGPGAVHCFFTALHLDEVKPRFRLRPGYEGAIAQIGVQVAAQRMDYGLECEFKLPWSNFPHFRATEGAILHVDAELSYSDGISRSYRSFAFGSPLSVDRPANLAAAKLVGEFERGDWRACGPVMMPLRIDVPWKQNSEPRVRASIAIPPNRDQEIGKAIFQLVDTKGVVVAEYAADESDVLEPQGNFVRRTADWPVSVASPGAYHVQAVVYDRDDEELTRITPRLVSVNMEQGY